MNLEDLSSELKNNNINSSACLINPDICPEGALCLCQKGTGRWDVILVERGETIINETFLSEHDACRFVLREVLMDPTYRNDFKQADLLTFKDKKKEILRKYGYK